MNINSLQKKKKAESKSRISKKTLFQEKNKNNKIFPKMMMLMMNTKIGKGIKPQYFINKSKIIQMQKAPGNYSKSLR